MSKPITITAKGKITNINIIIINNKHIFFYLLPQGDSNSPVSIIPLFLVLPLASVAVWQLQRRRGCQVLPVVRARGRRPEGVVHRGHLVVLLGGAEGVREGLGLAAEDLGKKVCFFLKKIYI